VTPSYVHKKTAKGKTYHYFRITGQRLSDDYDTACGEAAGLAHALRPVKKERRPHSRPHTEWRSKLRALLSAAKTRAAKKDREFTLTLSGLAGLLALQEYRCAVTGLPFVLEPDADYWRGPYSASLDRIDVSRGYTPDNVRLVLACVNIMLGEWGDQVFFSVAAAALEQRENRLSSCPRTTCLEPKQTPI
jgi:hypothetical protein